MEDIVEIATFSALPATGERSKIYIALDTNKTYRWSETAYVEIVASPGTTDAVVEGTSNLYFTTTRARASLSASNGVSYDKTTGSISGSALEADIAALSASFLSLANSVNAATATL